MPTINDPTEFTPREWQQMEFDKEQQQKAYEHDLEKTRLQLAHQKEINYAEIELKRLEAKWASWISLPKYIIKLPVMLLFGLAYIAHAIRGSKPTPQFWEFIKH